MITQESDSLFVVESKNGMKAYRFFKTPKRIGYDLAREPYEIYPQGVFVETFRDSTEEIESTLRADYAINHKYKNRTLWEAVGNVVATGENGRTLYTEQLFWDEGTERIYSNVDCRIEQADGVHVGDGIESDQALKHWRFRNTRSRLAIESPGGSSAGDARTEEADDEGHGGSEPEGPAAASNGPGTTVQPTEDDLSTPAPSEENLSGKISAEGNALGTAAPDMSGRRERRRTIQPVEGDESAFATGENPAPAAGDSIK